VFYEVDVEVSKKKRLLFSTIIFDVDNAIIYYYLIRRSRI